MKVKLDSYGIMPTRAHETDAGLDLYTPVDITINPYTNVVIWTGVHIQLPHGTVGMLKSKSGLMGKHGIVSEGVIDEGYTGEIGVCLFNHSNSPWFFMAGEKISQLVVLPVEYVSTELVDELNETDRGSNGFGSSGR